MKPISMKMQGLNSFLETQFIDFEKLTSHGLFGIFGPTGSGKTSILDGMTLALYGTTSRNSTNFINVNTNKASVEYIFSIQEKNLHKYFVSRSFKRTKDGTIRSDSAKFLEITGAEPIVLADRVGTVNAKCQEVLGLSKDDFFRTVVLPQGKFSEFLKLEGMERNKMLERLFHLEKYGERLAFLVKEHIGIWEGRRREQEGIFSRYESITWEAIQNLEERTGALEQDLIKREVVLKKSRQELEDKKGQLLLWKEYDSICERKEMILENQKEMEFLQENLKKAEIANELLPYFSDYQANIFKEERYKEKASVLKEQYLEKKQIFLSLQAELQIIEEKIQKKKPVLEQKRNDFSDALKLVEEKNLQINLLKVQKKTSEEIKEKLLDAQKKMELLLQDIEKRKLQKIQLQQKMIETSVSSEIQQVIMDGFQKFRDLKQLQIQKSNIEKSMQVIMGNMTEKETEKRQLLQDLKESEEEKEAYLQMVWKQQQNLCTELSDKLTKFQEKQVEIQKRKDEQEQFYIENMASVLAVSLEEGMPCPVCGSIHHEKPQILSQKEDIMSLQKQKETLEKEMQTVHETIASLKTQLQQAQQVDFESLSVPSELLEKLQGLQTEVVKRESEIEIIKKHYQERNQEREEENKEILKRGKELELLQKNVNIQNFQTEYERLQEKNKKREEMQNKLQVLEKNLELRIENREKGEHIIQKLQTEQTENSFLQKQTEEKLLEVKKQILEKTGTEEDLLKKLQDIEKSINVLDTQYENIKKLFEQASEEEKEVSAQLVASNALVEATAKDNTQKHRILTEKMKSFSITETSYIEKYKKEEMELLCMKKRIEDFQNEKIRIQEQFQQVKKKLSEERIDKTKFLLLEKEVEALELETAEKNKSFGAMRKELEQMKSAWEEKTKVTVLLKQIYSKLDILSELEGLFRGKRFVEYISRYYLEYIAREADVSLKEMTGNMYGMEIDENTSFIIRDYKNGGVSRPASTLSGGETFMASLALALALSSQIQMKGAAPLELFFLDEGFGTLDENCLEVVMNALEKIRNKRRSVGVITHVEEIKSRIPIHLLIEPAKAGEGGSKISIEEL